MRHTYATLTARAAMVARALGMPDGDSAGGLCLVRQNGGVSLFVRHRAGMEGGDLLHHGTAAETVAFLQGMITADTVRATVRRRIALPGEPDAVAFRETAWGCMAKPCA